MENIRGDALRGHLETMVLSVLEGGAAHGFEILRRLERDGCGALRLKEGTLYPVLYRLEQAGLVKAAWESDGEAGGRRGPRRRIYQLNKKGHQALAAGRGEWKFFVEIIGRIVGAPA
jgi:PadR family transcriptional regulator PadR